MAIDVLLYKPFPHQKVVHDAITHHLENRERFTEDFQKVFVVKAMRQVGKSTLAENELLRFALSFRCANAFVAHKLKLSRKVFKELILLAPKELVKRYNQHDLMIEFVNGSTIHFFSSEQRDGLRGFNVSGLLVIDEAAFMPPDIYYECISPWCDFHQAVTLIISTPRFKFGFFYELYKRGLQAGDYVQTFDFSRFDMSGIRSAGLLEEKRRTLSANQFRCEYLGEWIDGIGNVFSNFDYVDGTPAFRELYLGLDFGTGSGQDSTVLTALNEAGEQCFIWATNSLDPVKQVEEITVLLQQYKDKIRKFHAEKNSIGKIYLDLLKKHNPGIMITGFHTDNQSKRKLVEHLQVSFEQGKIRLLPDEEQSVQLSFYEAAVNTSTNNVSYNAARGFHDDYVMALMLANHSYMNRYGSYRFTIVDM